MEFGFLQCTTLNAVRGSYSPVTDREIYDSQITATDSEAKLLVDFFNRSGEGIYVGNVNSNKIAARKAFRLFPKGDIVYLNLVYPKPNKTELRLYLSSRAGFMPKRGDVWFLYESRTDGALWIGAMPESRWRGINTESLIDKREEVGSKKNARDPALVKKRMEEFASKKLDHINNLYSLCPYCHAAVHHAEGRVARKLLAKMYDDRSIGFHYGISKLNLFQLYSVEEIVKEADPLLSAIPEIEA